MNPLSVLVVEDSEDDMLLLLRELKRGGYTVEFERVETPGEMQAALDRRVWDLIIADYTLPSFSAPAALKLLQQRQQDLPFIIVSGTVDEETAVTAMKAGAHDYITKGKLARLIPAVERELREASERQKRQQAERDLRESEARFRQLAENVSESVFWMAEPKTPQFLYVSPTYEQIWGQSCANLYRNFQEWLMAIHPEDQAQIQTQFLEQSLTGHYETEYRIIQPDGSIRWIHDRAFPIPSTPDKPDRVVGIATDITEKKQLETQFYRAQRLESLGTLASGIAHDLNNVLTPILTISQLLTLQSGNLSERSQQMLKILEDSAKRGTGMIKQILTFARGTDGERHPVQVMSPVLEVVSVMQKTFPKSITIQTDIPEILPDLVSADATYLNQVLMNLCVNARDAMPDGGTITVSIAPYCVDRTFAQTNLDTQIGNYQMGQYVVMTVTDTGMGIPLEVRDRIFDPFFTTKPIGQGTGLGLATALGIVKNYGGFLQVLSEVGQGTAIKVYLPVIESTIVTTTSNAEITQFNGKGQTILLVDDDEAVKYSTQSLLESQEYGVLSTHDGFTAIGLYEQHQASIQLVVLDIMMPNMSGITLIQKLKAINPQVQIVAMSGLSANRESALAAGASAFLAKPYTLRQLLEILQPLSHPPNL